MAIIQLGNEAPQPKQEIPSRLHLGLNLNPLAKRGIPIDSYIGPVGIEVLRDAPDGDARSETAGSWDSINLRVPSRHLLRQSIDCVVLRPVHERLGARKGDSNSRAQLTAEGERFPWLVVVLGLLYIAGQPPRDLIPTDTPAPVDIAGCPLTGTKAEMAPFHDDGVTKVGNGFRYEVSAKSRCRGEERELVPGAPRVNIPQWPARALDRLRVQQKVLRLREVLRR